MKSDKLEVFDGRGIYDNIEYYACGFEPEEVDDILNKLGEKEYYLKSEVDKLLADKDEEIAELKNKIAPIQPDKTLQERLNEVCEKHGVSTLQDLDWAICESEKRHTECCIESIKTIARHKYKRCMAMASNCALIKKKLKLLNLLDDFQEIVKIRFVKIKRWEKWCYRWIQIADKFKENE